MKHLSCISHVCILNGEKITILIELLSLRNTHRTVATLNLGVIFRYTIIMQRFCRLVKCIYLFIIIIRSVCDDTQRSLTPSRSRLRFRVHHLDFSIRYSVRLEYFNFIKTLLNAHACCLRRSMYTIDTAI